MRCVCIGSTNDDANDTKTRQYKGMIMRPLPKLSRAICLAMNRKLFIHNIHVLFIPNSSTSASESLSSSSNTLRGLSGRELAGEVAQLNGLGYF